MFPLYDDQPRERAPVMTVLLILLNVLVYALWQEPEGVNRSVVLAGLSPVDLLSNAPGAFTHLWTSMFMHGSWGHLIGNMWFLWIFGDNIEDACGSLRFLCFYLLCGMAAAAVFVLGAPHSTVPLVGASGAVAGVLGAYMMKFPRARVRSFIFVVLVFFVRVPAWVFLLYWFGIQIAFQYFNGRSAANDGGVAYLAHVGGFVAGMALIFLYQTEPQEQAA